MPSRRNDRAADALRAIRFTRHYTRHAEGSVLVEFGDTRVLCTASVEDGVPRVPARQGPGLDYGRVRHAAARHAHALGARGGARQADRPHPGDPAADRAIAPRRGRSARARRTQRHARLRRVAGRRRHAHGRDHRRLRGTRRCDCRAARAPGVEQQSPARPGGRGLGRASSAASRCWIWITTRTPRPKPT